MLTEKLQQVRELPMLWQIDEIGQPRHPRPEEVLIWANPRDSEEANKEDAALAEIKISDMPKM